MLESLDNQLPLAVMWEVVGFEDVTLKEWLKVGDVDLASLEEWQGFFFSEICVFCISELNWYLTNQITAQRPGIYFHISITYPIQEILLWHLNNIMVGSIARAHVCGLLVHKLSQQEEQEFVVVSLEGQIPWKVLKTKKKIVGYNLVCTLIHKTDFILFSRNQIHFSISS